MKKGNSVKYKSLQNLFENKYFSAAEKYMCKNIDALKETNPGQAYSVLKRMGAQPLDCVDSNDFTLPEHENLTNLQSAEKIADHLSEISLEYQPLDIGLLPEGVQRKLKEKFPLPPVITVQETLDKINSAKKPRSGVPGDLPRTITKELSNELAGPLI